MNTVFKHPLERGEKNRIEVSIDNYFRNGTLKLDGNEIWRFESEEQFKQGTLLTLPDGSELAIKLVPHPGNGQRVIYIARNGEPLPKSAFDDQSQFDQAQNFLRAIAAAYIVGGLMSFIADSGIFRTFTGGSIASLVAGILLLAITFLPKGTKRMAFLAGAVISLLEASYYFTHPPLDKLPIVLRLAAIIMPIACFKIFGDAERQEAERIARKAASRG